ncbi:MAG: hypothetical protein Q8M02_05385 [Candidatus Didemnitutus sp.]|nr:hypothetical protein [Candidatus Didemnitutus sp.]
MEPLIFLVSGGGVIALVLWAIQHDRKKRRANLTSLAQRLGLEVGATEKSWVGTQFEVRGQRLGKDVRFWSFTTGSGKSRRHWVAVGVRAKDVGEMKFNLQRQGFGTRVAEWFGAKEITVGDRAFDDAWFVRTSEPDYFGVALVAPIRAKLMAARAAGATEDFKLEDGWVSYAERGSFSSERHVARLESLVPVLYDLADVAEVCAAAIKP